MTTLLWLLVVGTAFSVGATLGTIYGVNCAGRYVRKGGAL